MELKNNYYNNKEISMRLKSSIKRILSKYCDEEELLLHQDTLLRKIDGNKTKEELINYLNKIKFKKRLKKTIDK